MDRVAPTGPELVADTVEHTRSTHPPITAGERHPRAVRTHAMHWPHSPDGPRMLIAPPITARVSDAPPRTVGHPWTRVHLPPIPAPSRTTAAAAETAPTNIEAHTAPIVAEAPIVPEAPAVTQRAAPKVQRTRRPRRPHVAGGARILMAGLALTATFMLTAAMAAADRDPVPPPLIDVPPTSTSPAPTATGT